MCSFLWLSNITLRICTQFFIHSSVDGHIGCFHVLAIGNSTAMNNGIHMSFSILVSSEYTSRSGIAGSYGSFISSLLKNLHTILHSGIHMSFSILVSSGYMPRSEIVGAYGVFIPSFLRNPKKIKWIKKLWYIYTWNIAQP